MGLAQVPEYHCWHNMIRRCADPRDKAFKNYGARGIVVCPEWMGSFERFRDDMGPRPTPKHTLERMNNSGPYAPWNCRWATRSEQARNKRNTVFLALGGSRVARAAIVAESGIPLSTVRARLKDGRDPLVPRRHPRQVVVDGRLVGLPAAAKIVGISVFTVYDRMKRGKTAEQALGLA